MNDEHSQTTLACSLGKVVSQLASAEIAYRYARYLKQPSLSERIMIELKYGKIQTASNRSARTAIELLRLTFSTVDESRSLNGILKRALNTNNGLLTDNANYLNFAIEEVEQRATRLRPLLDYLNAMGTKFDTDGLLYSVEFDTIEMLLRKAIDVCLHLSRMSPALDGFTDDLQSIERHLNYPSLA